MPQIAQEGIFRGAAITQSLYESQQSKSVAIRLTFEATEMINPATGAWGAIEPWHTSGRFWVVGKDGALITKACEDLMAIGWDGSLEGVSQNEYVTRPCQFTVKAEKSQDGTKTFYNAAWVSPFDFAPGGGSNPYAADESRGAALEQQYGSQLRALAAQTGASGTKQPESGTVQGVPPTPETMTLTKDDVGQVPREIIQTIKPSGEVPF